MVRKGTVPTGTVPNLKGPVLSRKIQQSAFASLGFLWISDMRPATKSKILG